MRYLYSMFAILALIFQYSIAQIDTEYQDLKKVALIIGNGNYATNILANPENDARAMENALIDLGFFVLKYENLNQINMKKAIDDFGLMIKNFDICLFFYAGHGIQYQGSNYLIPIDANLKSEAQIEFDCVHADRILALMGESGTIINIVILDACRNNPFERSWTRSSQSKGLAFMNAPQGTLIAYSTSPGKTASDGSGANSPYTSAILESLKIKDISIIQMFQSVTKRVLYKTNNEQTPWISSSLTGDFYIYQNTSHNLVSQNSTSTNNDINKRTIENTYTEPVENIIYKTVRIGNQIWLAENLKATKYNDGTEIPLINDKKTWKNLTTPGFCMYNNDPNLFKTYGGLYNWYTVNTGKLCPIGWHVPLIDEWESLFKYLGSNDGGKLKTTGLEYWDSPNIAATNETGFSALGSGLRTRKGTFSIINKFTGWWTNAEGDPTTAGVYYTTNDFAPADRFFSPKTNGYSVRCIK